MAAATQLSLGSRTVLTAPTCSSICQAGRSRPARACRLLRRAVEKKGEEREAESVSSQKPELFSSEAMSKLNALRKEPPNLSGNSNLLQGALEEAQLITWPKPQKALLDTVLVIGIVTATGVLLFASNVALKDISDWWYHFPKPDWL